MNNRCVSCDDIIPEGIMVCPYCSEKSLNRKDSAMVETVVSVNTIKKVKEFSNLCSKCEGDVTVYGGKHIASGKSLMGLLTLNLKEPLKVEFHGDIPYEVREGMKKFIID